MSILALIEGRKPEELGAIVKNGLDEFVKGKIEETINDLLQGGDRGFPDGCVEGADVRHQKRILQATSENEMRKDRGKRPERQAQSVRDEDHSAVQANGGGSRIRHPVPVSEGAVPE